MSEPESSRGAASFLVRLWREPRTVRGSAAPVRVYIRNLRSGQERYLASAEELAQLLEAETGEREPVPGEDDSVQRRAG